MKDPLYGWQVRLTTSNRRSAVELAELLEGEGLACSRSMREVFVSAESEARAQALAHRLERTELVESAQVQIVGALGGV